MTPCIIESPYAGDVAGNKAYLQECIRWCLDHGYTPYASHQMLTDALDDSDPDQRSRGMHAGIAMSHALANAGAPWFFFADRGFSNGMCAALDVAVLPNIIYLHNPYALSSAIGRASAYFVHGHWYGPAPAKWHL